LQIAGTMRRARSVSWRLTSLAAAAALTACATSTAGKTSGKTDDRGSDAGSAGGTDAGSAGGTDAGSGSAKAPAVECFLIFSSDQCTNDGCPTVQVASSNHVVDGSYPSFNDTLGDSTLPYNASVGAAGAFDAIGSMGNFSFTITNGNSPHASVASSLSGVPLVELTDSAGVWVLGAVWATVPSFTYQGQTYDQAAASCQTASSP
jgi:hypothetical protein